MDAKLRSEIIGRYGAVLEKRAAPHIFGRICELPYEKAIIRQALLDDLLEKHDPQFREHLKIGIMMLESFVSDQEFSVVVKMDEWLSKNSQAVPDASTWSRDVPDASTWDAYEELMRRVHEAQGQVLDCLRRFFPAES